MPKRGRNKARNAEQGEKILNAIANIPLEEWLSRHSSPVSQALSDPEFYTRDLSRHLGQASQGAAAGALGAPVDLASVPLRAMEGVLGRRILPEPEQVVGSTEFFGRLMGAPTRSTSFQVGSMGPIPDAMDAARMARVGTDLLPILAGAPAFHGTPHRFAPSDTSFKRIDTGDSLGPFVAGETVDNWSSVPASLGSNYTVEPGIQRVPLSEFYQGNRPKTFDRRTRDLAEQIRQSGRMDPLIVAIDEKGPYVLEGGHRLDASYLLDADSIPAVVVREEGIESLGRFGRFDSSKIGTGEGNTAFGHGLYFAENPGVARSYIGNADARYARLSGHMDPKTEFAFDFMEKGDTDLQVMERMQDYYGNQATFDEISEAITKARAFDPGSGSVLEVDIPDEAIDRMLDWDKPLSEQPDIVAAMPESVQRRIRQLQSSFGDEKVTGEALYETIIADEIGFGGFRSTPEQSAFLNELGIPGIRYLDAGSRSTGEGTRNFVVFDDTIPKIIDRK